MHTRSCLVVLVGLFLPTGLFGFRQTFQGKEYQLLLQDEVAKYPRLRYQFAESVLLHESHGSLRVRDGKAGEIGLMQILPGTFRFVARQILRVPPLHHLNARNPQHNVAAGVALLNWLLERYEGNETLTLIGYNAGHGTADRVAAGLKAGKMPRVPASTRNYIARILGSYALPTAASAAAISAAVLPPASAESSASAKVLSKNLPAALPSDRVPSRSAAARIVAKKAHAVGFAALTYTEDVRYLYVPLQRNYTVSKVAEFFTGDKYNYRSEGVQLYAPAHPTTILAKQQIQYEYLQPGTIVRIDKSLVQGFEEYPASRDLPSICEEFRINRCASVLAAYNRNAARSEIRVPGWFERYRISGSRPQLPAEPPPFRLASAPTNAGDSSAPLLGSCCWLLLVRRKIPQRALRRLIAARVRQCPLPASNLGPLLPAASDKFG